MKWVKMKTKRFKPARGKVIQQRIVTGNNLVSKNGAAGGPSPWLPLKLGGPKRGIQFPRREGPLSYIYSGASLVSFGTINANDADGTSTATNNGRFS
jgi:hypothetical protein